MTIVEDFEGEFEVPRTQDMHAFMQRLSAAQEGTMLLYKVPPLDPPSPCAWPCAPRSCCRAPCIGHTLRRAQERHPNTHLSARNIRYLNLVNVGNINARDLLKAKKVIVTKSAMAVLRERYAAA